jgi:hypothetical protein
VLRDPITDSKVEVYGWNVFDFTQSGGVSAGTLSFRVKKGTALFDKIKDQPIRLQGYPFFLDILTENRTELIEVCRVANGFQVAADYIDALGCEIKYLDNLEFFKKIQQQRWLYNDND